MVYWEDVADSYQDWENLKLHQQTVKILLLLFCQEGEVSQFLKKLNASYPLILPVQ